MMNECIYIILVLILLIGSGSIIFLLSQIVKQVSQQKNREHPILNESSPKIADDKEELLQVILNNLVLEMETELLRSLNNILASGDEGEDEIVGKLNSILSSEEERGANIIRKLNSILSLGEEREASKVRTLNAKYITEKKMRG